MLVIKLQYGEDIRRLSLETQLTFRTLTELACCMFPEIKETKFVFKYRDDEGDLITITSDAELSEALRVTGSKSILRITVAILAKKANCCGQKSATANPLEGLAQLLNCTELSSLVPVLQQLAEKYLPFLFQIFDKVEVSIVPPNGTAPSSPSANEHRATCDGCSRRIFNVRYKCNQCPDYDLCEECKQKTGVHTPEHTFVKITDPRAPIHHAICDHCNSYIVGRRFKCNSCMDYDLCEKCVQLPGVHDGTHPFSQIERPVPRCPRRRGCRMNRNQCPSNRGQCPGRTQCPASVQTENQEEKPVEKPVETPVEKEEVKPIERKEEIKPIEKKAEIKVAEKIIEQPKPVAVEAPKQEKQETQEAPKSSHPFELKLKQLDEMGFADRSKNIALLVKNQMDLVKTIRDLLEL